MKRIGLLIYIALISVLFAPLIILYVTFSLSTAFLQFLIFDMYNFLRDGAAEILTRDG